jgi:hypothetical protein
MDMKKHKKKASAPRKNEYKLERIHYLVIVLSAILLCLGFEAIVLGTKINDVLGASTSLTTP